MATTGSSSSAATSEPAAETADLVVGLATHNHAASAGGVVREIAAALDGLDPSVRRLIVVADGGSTDGTPDRVRAAAGDGRAVATVPFALHTSDALELPYHGFPGRARAVHAILREAQARQARACVVVDARAEGFPADWLRVIASLEREEVDYVVPVYRRHPATAGLLHGVVYPTFRALYGTRVRSPLATEFACSRRFMDAVVPDPIWDTDGGQRGIDLWLASSAAAGGFRVGNALLGAKPAEEAHDVDVATTVAQVVGALFADMERRVMAWQRTRGSRAVLEIGDPAGAPGPPEVDVASLVESFKRGYEALHQVWAEVLPPVAILQWRRLSVQPVDGFRVDEALWARTIYDFAMGHRLRVIARDHLLRSLTPMYLAWVASFILQVRHARAEETEARVERQCLAFEAEKPYLISQWRWPERFRPVKLRR